MSKRGDREFLLDIKEAAERILGYVGEMSYESFIADIKTQDAVLRNLEIIGEAIKNISKGLKKEHEEIEWKEIAGMRDRVIHQYFGIKWEIVWSVIKDKVPELREKIGEILKQFPGGLFRK
jgi:uncharacterized protein with HEPN domain